MLVTIGVCAITQKLYVGHTVRNLGINFNTSKVLQRCLKQI